MALAKMNALKAQLGLPITPDTFTTAEDIDSFLDALMLFLAGRGEPERPRGPRVPATPGAFEKS
jgi:hypothetical protein